MRAQVLYHHPLIVKSADFTNNMIHALLTTIADRVMLATVCLLLLICHCLLGTGANSRSVIQHPPECPIAYSMPQHPHMHATASAHDATTSRSVIQHPSECPIAYSISQQHPQHPRAPTTTPPNLQHPPIMSPYSTAASRIHSVS